ncbi:MAG: hypothetical protein WBO93_13355 [Gammaproteobacteria bacterium]
MAQVAGVRQRHFVASHQAVAAVLAVPRLGATGHQECEVVGEQRAKDVGACSIVAIP